MKKWIDKYKALSAPVKSSLWFVICNIVQKGIALVSTPIFTRIMTTDQYGIYTVYQSWYQIIVIFATLELSAGVFNNGLTHFPEEKKIFVSTLQGLSTTITAILFLVYCINIEFWNRTFDLPSLFIFAMFVQLLFEPAYLFWSAEQRYTYRYRGLIFTTMLIAVGSPLLGIFTVISTEYKAEARVLSFVFVQFIIGLFFYIYNFRRGKSFFSAKYWRYALNFSLPLIPHYLSMTVLNQSDRIMINNMVGSSEAAIYGIAYTLAMMMTIVTGAINNSSIPFTYQHIKKKEFSKIGIVSNALLLLVGGVTIIAMAFGPELIMLFATKEYYEAIWIMPPVAATVFFMFLYPLFANVEFYFEKTKFIMVASCVGAGLNVILNYVFISASGYYAAGYTTLFCYIIFSLAHYIAYKRIIEEKKDEIEPIYNVKFIFAISLVMLFAMLAMLVVYEQAVIRYGIVLIACGLLISKRSEITSIIKQLKKAG